MLTVDTEPAVLSLLMQKEERLVVWDRRSAGCDPADPAPSVCSASRSPIALDTLLDVFLLRLVRLVGQLVGYVFLLPDWDPGATRPVGAAHCPPHHRVRSEVTWKW